MRKQLTRSSALALTLIVALTLAGCAAKGTQKQISPFERAVQVNALVAEANNGVARTVIAAQQSGFISVPDAAVMLDAQRRVTLVRVEIDKLLALGPQQANATQLRALIAQLKAAMSVLVANGGAAVKNADSREAIVASVTQMAALADALLAALQEGGVL